MGKDLRRFIEVLRAVGSDYFVEVNRPLKPELEVCVLQQKLAKEGRFPAVYCPRIEGSELPLVTNLFGSYEMLGLALGLDPKKVEKPAIVREYKNRLQDLRPPQAIPASLAPVKELILRGNDVDLGLLPITRHAERDSGKYITIGSMICRDPDTGIINAGVYRHELKGKDRLGCFLAPPQHAAYILRRYAELGKPMEVVLFVGHHPAVTIGSLYRGSINMNELEVAGALLGEPLEVTQAETVDLPVPAYAEIAIEGLIDRKKGTTDGPFAEYSGYYGEVTKFTDLIQVTCITMRKDAIYHDLDPAHREHTLSGILAKASNAFDAVERAVPSVKAVHLPPSGCHVYSIYVSIRKRIQGEGKLAGLAALAGESSARLAVIVDEDIDIYDEEEVQWAIATRVVADQDVSIIPGVTSEVLNPSGYNESRLERGIMASKMIIDATKPVDRPFATRITPPNELWDSMRLEDYLYGQK